jgi:hypothetical protein
MVLDHLSHCVGPGDTSQCVKGQTPDFPAGHYPNHTAGALVRVDGDKMWKLIVEPAAQATWYGRFSPNGTKKVVYDDDVGCWPTACLFDLAADPTEHVDVGRSEPAALGMMLARFHALEATYHPPKANPPTDAAGLCSAIEQARGFMAPWRPSP